MIRTRELARMALFAALIAVGAFIRIPVPGVPLTLQTLFTTLAGVLLGAKYGALSVAAYVVIGLAGVPVFTGGGGLGYVLRPTFGYLIGFCIGTYVTGTIAGRARLPSIPRLLAANFAGLGVIYACGTLYYWLIHTFYIGSAVGARALLLACCIVPAPGDIITCVFAAFLSRRLLAIRNGRAAP